MSKWMRMKRQRTSSQLQTNQIQIEWQRKRFRWSFHSESSNRNETKWNEFNLCSSTGGSNDKTRVRKEYLLSCFVISIDDVYSHKSSSHHHLTICEFLSWSFPFVRSFVVFTLDLSRKTITTHWSNSSVTSNIKLNIYRRVHFQILFFETKNGWTCGKKSFLNFRFDSYRSIDWSKRRKFTIISQFILREETFSLISFPLVEFDLFI